MSQVERDVMSRIAKTLNVGESMVDEVLLEAKRALHE